MLLEQRQISRNPKLHMRGDFYVCAADGMQQYYLNTTEYILRYHFLLR